MTLFVGGLNYHGVAHYYSSVPAALKYFRIIFQRFQLLLPLTNSCYWDTQDKEYINNRYWNIGFQEQMRWFSNWQCFYLLKSKQDILFNDLLNIFYKSLDICDNTTIIWEQNPEISEYINFLVLFLSSTRQSW